MAFCSILGTRPDAAAAAEPLAAPEYFADLNLDQIVSAFIGPLLFTARLALQGGYTLGFQMMWVPALLTVAVVVFTRLKFPDPSSLEDAAPVASQAQPASGPPALSRPFWLYSLFTFFAVLGFASFQLISYHLQVKGVVTGSLIPTLYAVAIGVDAVVAIIVGKWYDKKGMAILLAIPVLSLPIPLLGFSGSAALVIAAAQVVALVCFGFFRSAK
jgi:hypothetical protein